MMGIGNAGMWGPLATTATRNLPMSQAGAGAGIYNTTRTVGSVIGSAAIAAFMQSRLEANLPGAGDAAGGFDGGTLPDFVVERLLDRDGAGDPAAGGRAADRRRRRAVPASTEGLGRGRVARRERASSQPRRRRTRRSARKLTPLSPRRRVTRRGRTGRSGRGGRMRPTPRRQYPLIWACAGAARASRRRWRRTAHESGCLARRPDEDSLADRSEPVRAARTVAPAASGATMCTRMSMPGTSPRYPATHSPEPGTAAMTSTARTGRAPRGPSG